jgi:hypothetical protein
VKEDAEDAVRHQRMDKNERKGATDGNERKGATDGNKRKGARGYRNPGDNLVPHSLVGSEETERYEDEGKTQAGVGADVDVVHNKQGLVEEQRQHQRGRATARWRSTRTSSASG